MSCTIYPTFRAKLEAQALAARVKDIRLENFPAFQQALAMARYHRETCPDCDAEFIAAFPELAGQSAHTEILSYQLAEEEA